MQRAFRNNTPQVQEVLVSLSCTNITSQLEQETESHMLYVLPNSFPILPSHLPPSIASRVSEKTESFPPQEAIRCFLHGAGPWPEPVSLWATQIELVSFIIFFLSSSSLKGRGHKRWGADQTWEEWEVSDWGALFEIPK